MDVLDFLFVDGRGVAKNTPPLHETKTDVDGYYKTPAGAVICKDDESLNAYKKRKAKDAQLNSMKDDIDQLKNDMTEIKELLKGLVK
jgi:hypothetical protein